MIIFTNTAISPGTQNHYNFNIIFTKSSPLKHNKIFLLSGVSNHLHSIHHIHKTNRSVKHEMTAKYFSSTNPNKAWSPIKQAMN